MEGFRDKWVTQETLWLTCAKDSSSWAEIGAVGGRAQTEAGRPGRDSHSLPDAGGQAAWAWRHGWSLAGLGKQAPWGFPSWTWDVRVREEFRVTLHLLPELREAPQVGLAAPGCSWFVKMPIGHASRDAEWALGWQGLGFQRGGPGLQM